MSVSISGSNDTLISKLDKFFGLNQNPDGDTKLKMGEAAVCRNWRVTRDYNLQRRPGTRTLLDFGSDSPVYLWHGNVNSVDTLLAATGGHLYLIDGSWNAEDLGRMETDNRVTFFPFDNIVYIQNGHEYMEYDGMQFKAVEGYRPLVVTNRTPDGGSGTTLEGINKLNGLRRVQFTPDNESSVYVLPESDLMSVDYVMMTDTGEYMDHSKYSVDNLNGKVTFVTAPSGTSPNHIEIGYSAPSSLRSEVSSMTNAEIFLGTTDNAVFLYGDGTNKAIYSGVDYSGVPRADYFPDLNEIEVADSNTPITGMIRHYSKLLCFKSNSTYSINYGLITLSDGSNEYAFYVTPINRAIGNAPLGQVRLVLNSPYTLFGNDLYEWKNSSSYSSNLSVDERQARRISDKVYSTLNSFNADECYCYDDNDNQEYYICCGDKCLIKNYAADTWYEYSGLSITSISNYGNEVYFGTEDGKLKHFDSSYYSDDGEVIDSYWESGSMDFGKPYMRKMMSQMWVGITPTSSGKVTVTIMTDKKSDYTEKDVTSSLFDFSKMNFENFSFDTNRRAKVKKLKIKGKKFVYLKIVYKSDDINTDATIVNTNLMVRTTGYAK